MEPLGDPTVDPAGAASHPAGQRRPPKAVPERSPDYAHLSLDALRAYRQALTREESNVSYWRRILQARLDVVREGRLNVMDASHLRPVLTDKRVGSGRQALLEVMPVADIPPLPNLAELWDRRVTEGDEAGLTRLEADLDAAETQLSSYRASLHRRIGDATGELIARYREQPTLCLTALPLQRARRVVTA